MGSAYLAKGDNENALAAFLDAFNVMNNVSAFKELEKRSTSLMGAESNKGYKGDPYEKMYNSLYVGLLLIKKGDLENARAAFKNGIICDSDSTEEKYQSDDPLLFLLRARVELLLGDKSLSDDFYKQALDILYKLGAFNQALTARYQMHAGELKKVQDTISSICSESSESGICDQSKMDSRRNEELNYLKKLLLNKAAEIEKDKKMLDEANRPGNEPEYLKNFIDKNSNVLLVVESGKGPIKARSGQYGERAIFLDDDNKIQKVEISVDGKGVSLDPVVGDVYYQATTRGGRKMDSILKGKVQFKNDSAQTAQALGVTSLAILNQGNQSNDPDVRSAAAMMAAGTALAAGISSLMSQATNPAADVRHWSFLPNKISVYCLNLPVGHHKIEIMSADGAVMNSKINGEINVESNKNNINFFRLLPNSGIPKNNDGSKFIYMAVYNDELSANTGKEKCILDSNLPSAQSVDVNALLDNNLRKAVSLGQTCSDAIKGMDGKYYVFKKIN